MASKKQDVVEDGDEPKKSAVPADRKASKAGVKVAAVPATSAKASKPADGRDRTRKPSAAKGTEKAEKVKKVDKSKKGEEGDEGVLLTPAPAPPVEDTYSGPKREGEPPPLPEPIATFKL